MAEDMSAELAEFIERVKPRLRGEVGAMLVPELEPCQLAFDDRLPDRLLCGQQIFDYLRSQGIPERRLPDGFWRDQLTWTNDSDPVSDILDGIERARCTGADPRLAPC